ncbi:MAG TPA: histidine ammonia-lyase [Thermotogota bacterium]|nr:histidine ammonia-lyase [Thermotogota bacterium]
MIHIDGNSLTLEQVWKVCHEDEQVRIDAACFPAMEKSAEQVAQFVRTGKIVYGVSTGFGALASVSIDPGAVGELQRNIILSHAAGVGELFEAPLVRGMMLLRANSLVKGFSGIRPSSVSLLVDMLNKGIHPLVPTQGSVGASGDLAPLAHIAMAMMGQGMVEWKGKRLAAADALQQAGLKSLEPVQKEGLALLNGTQMMNAVLCEALRRSLQLLEWVMVSAAMSVDALRASTIPFDPRIQQLRPHPGQQCVARHMNELLEGSTIRESHKNCGKVQDAYSLRAIPQVYGAVWDTVEYVRQVVEREMNSVTDNPLIFGEEGLSGGNFHGEPLALVADFLSIALCELGSITERRIDRLVNPMVSSLPAFLSRGSQGLHSGYMLWQYTAAALVSENKSLSHPASVDSIPTSAYQEDHVSMGSIAARKALSILQNAEKIVAIETMLALRGLAFLKPLETGRRLLPLVEQLEGLLQPYTGDRYFGDDFQAILDWIRTHPVPVAGFHS